jgi:hypothetical protein
MSYILAFLEYQNRRAMLTYDLDLEEYRYAPSGTGKYASDWKDKPHRLVYDLVEMVQQLRNELKEQRHEMVCDILTDGL